MADTALDVMPSDERSPYEAAAVVVRTIARLDSALPGEDDVWAAFVRWRGEPDREYRQYLDAIRRTRHSIFYFQLQHLYEFGIERIGDRGGIDFCTLAGRDFAEVVLAGNLQPLLQVALAKPEAFQRTVVEMIQSNFAPWAGNRYALGVEIRPAEIVLTVESLRPELDAKSVTQAGLNPDRCFRNSCRFMAGAVDRYVQRVVADPDPAEFRVEIGPGRCRMQLPIRADGRFAYETLTRTLIGHIQAIEERRRVAVEEEQLERDLVIGSPGMRQVWDRARKAGQSDEIVLLCGESGTGKSFLARKIHELSARRDAPFIQVALTTLGTDNLIQSDLFGHEKGAFTGAAEQKQGLFSLADGGTIFLDEIGDASPELQAKLLQVVETSTFRRLGGTKLLKVDVRILAATHRDLGAMAAAGTFRQDLYYRLNVIPVHIPPLRDRREAIPALAEYLFSRAQMKAKGPRKRLPRDVAERLADYAWPGNIRELENALKQALAMAEGEILGLKDFPPAVREAIDRREAPAQPPAPPREMPPAAHAGPGAPAPINVEALRLAVRSIDPDAAGLAAAPHTIPAHIDYAKATWLAVLIDECGGDLARIAQYWDRSAEKTLRALVRAYGLEGRLAEARNIAGRRPPARN